MNMLKRFVILSFAIVGALGAAAVTPRLVKAADNGWGSTSVNTTVFRNNSLVTHDGVQYISYYDADGYLTLGSRDVDADRWNIHRTQ